MPSSRVRSYLMQRCAYLGKAALGGIGREWCGSNCYLQRMQNSKWVKCKLGESPNNVLIPRNFLIVKVAVSFFFVTAQQTLTTNVWLCATCRDEQEPTCCEIFGKQISNEELWQTWRNDSAAFVKRVAQVWVEMKNVSSKQSSTNTLLQSSCAQWRPSLINPLSDTQCHNRQHTLASARLISLNERQVSRFSRQVSCN